LDHIPFRGSNIFAVGFSPSQSFPWFVQLLNLTCGIGDQVRLPIHTNRQWF
jgi:hypothetical protein